MLKRLSTLLLIVIAFFLGILITQLSQIMQSVQRTSNAPDISAVEQNQLAPANAPLPTNTRRAQGIALAVTPTPSETIPPYTALPSLTPSNTLRPPPTFEPATSTLLPSPTQTITPTSTTFIDVSIPNLRGGESPTPTSTAGCTPRKDWKLTYTVQRNDALARIADLYSTTVDELMAGNCLTDKNFIVIGQVLKVPGKVQPNIPAVQCIPFAALTPMDGTLAISGGGNVTFNWRGPRAPRNLIRIMDSSGNKVFEDVLELRQNDSFDIGVALPKAGTYTWYVYPLDSNFVQVCPEGGPWTFTKPAAPTATPPVRIATNPPSAP